MPLKDQTNIELDSSSTKLVDNAVKPTDVENQFKTASLNVPASGEIDATLSEKETVVNMTSPEANIQQSKPNKSSLLDKILLPFQKLYENKVLKSNSPATKPKDSFTSIDNTAEKHSEFQTLSQKLKSLNPIMSKNKEKIEKTDSNGLTLKERKEILEAERIYNEGVTRLKDLIAPSSMKVNYRGLQLSGLFTRSFYVYSYPRYINTNWLSPVVNFDATMDISHFIYPIDSAQIMRVLKTKVAQMNASMRINQEKGLVRDPQLETQLEDAETLRTEIQRGQEKFFQYALYFTIYADDEEKLEKTTKQLEGILGGRLVLTKRADLRAEQAFTSTLPLALDEIDVHRNMNTSPLSSTFPFTSSELTSNKGILYGLNRHNDSLIIFDRFSLENANSVVFAKSGAGKSYTVKLEILRSLMLNTDVIVIDPENEYEALAETVGGSYMKVSLNADRRINPFDLPSPLKDEILKPGDLLRSNIINLHGLMKLMLGQMSPLEEGLLDRALNDVYALKGITMDLVDPSGKEVPTMEDLKSVLDGMEGAESLVQRIQKYTTGTFSGIFNKPTNIDLGTGLIVFSIRDLEDSLRPIAMYIILNFIWNRVRSSLKKRILVVDEAWTMMQNPDSAKFLYGLVKRARKYFLGVTTITQDVEDFLKSEYGKPIITNSSMQVLLKQAPSAADILTKIFNLTEGEKYLLLNSGVGQGLFFAGNKHAAIQVIASYNEDKIITTNPQEILNKKG
jgi:type IV secretory pathway VirB4 component